MTSLKFPRWAKDILVSLQQLWKIGAANDLLEIPQALCT